MTLSVSCETCGSSYKVKEEHAGKRFPCRKCQSMVTVAVPAATVSVGERPRTTFQSPTNWASRPWVTASVAATAVVALILAGIGQLQLRGLKNDQAQIQTDEIKKELSEVNQKSAELAQLTTGLKDRLRQVSQESDKLTQVADDLRKAQGNFDKKTQEASAIADGLRKRLAESEEQAQKAFASAEQLKRSLSQADQKVQDLEVQLAKAKQQEKPVAKASNPGPEPKVVQRITADVIEERLKKLGFDVPDAAVKADMSLGPDGVADGVMSFRPIPRPIGEPKKRSGNVITQYSYESKNKAGAVFKVKLEDGRFFFFADKSAASKEAMSSLLQNLNPQLAATHDELVQECKKKQTKTSAEVKNIMLTVTPRGSVLSSKDLPVIFGSEASNYGW